MGTSERAVIIRSFLLMSNEKIEKIKKNVFLGLFNVIYPVWLYIIRFALEIT
jgi:hypothetical protein